MLQGTMIVRHANESLLLSILPTQKCGMFNIRLLQRAHHFEYFPFTIEYLNIEGRNHANSSKCLF